MAYNGSGTFSRLYNWVTDRNNTIKIRADRMDAEFDGIADALSNVVCRDGQSTISADIPFNNKKITGLADAAADTDALNRQTADARYQRNADDLTNITDLADGDEFTVTDATDGLNKAVLWSVLKSELTSEATSQFFPSGTSMLFLDAAAPTGWTKDTTHNNKALRIVNTSGGGTGGSQDFTTAFGSRTIAQNMLPNATLSGTTAGGGAHNHDVTQRYYALVEGGGGSVNAFVRTVGLFTSTDATTTDTAANHTHTFTTSSINGGVTQQSFVIDPNYVNAIIANKD